MQVFIANCTMQYAHLSYRVPEVPSLIVQPVDSGRQVRVPVRDMNSKQLMAIVDYFKLYGGVTVEEATAGLRRSQKVTYLIGNGDLPIPPEFIERVMQHNRGALIMQGQQIREEAAIAASVGMEQQGHTPNAAKRMEMSIEQVSGEGVGDPEKKFEEGLRITPEPPKDRADVQRRGSGRK